MANNPSNRLSKLRRYMHHPSDFEVVKDMMDNGLTDAQILSALGYSDSFSRNHHPDAHSFSEALPTDEEERQQMSAASDEPVMDEQDAEEDQQEESDPITHLVGLLNHVVKNKPNKKPKSSSNRSNRSKPLT